MQRARQLARMGRVPARRSGGVWLLDAQATRARPVGRGRPLSGRSAWAAIDVLDGRDPAGVSRSERIRARRRVDDIGALEPGALSARALVLDLRAHPGVVDRLDADPRVVVGGARAAAHHGADLISVDDHEYYVRERDLEGLIRGYGLRPARPGDANVKLHVSDRLPRVQDRVVSAGTAAVDLLDSGDERSVRAARQMLRALQREVHAG